MNNSDILALYDRELRKEVTYPGMAKEVTPQVVRFIRPKPGMCFVLYSELTEDNADSVIAEQIAYFRQNDLRFEWKVYGHDRPPDLGERLLANGLKDEQPEAIMALELTETPNSLLQPVTADIRRLTDASDLVDVVTVLESVWGGDYSWVYRRLGDHMPIPGYLSVYVGYVDDEPASAGWTYFNQGHFAGLWAGSTVAEMRGRGLYKALLAVRIQEAIARGKQFVTLDAGPMSQPIVARYRFRQLTTAVGYEWEETVGAEAPG